MIAGINHTTFSVADLDRAFQFYSGTLGMKPVARWYCGAYLLAGEAWICLTLETHIASRPQLGYDHVAFTVADDIFCSFSEQLIAAGVTVWQDNRSEGQSLYFLDPDGHKLEIHASDLRSRLASLKRTPPKDLVLFEP